MTKRKRHAADRTHSRPAPSEPVATRHGSRAWLLAGLTALFVARPLFPTESAVYGDGLPVVMLWIVLAILWLLGAIGKPRWEVRFGWVDAAVVVLVAWHTVAGVAAVFRASPRPAVNMTWEWLGMGLAFLLARQVIVTRREARAVTAVMAALAVALAGYGLYQYTVEMPAMRAAYAADPVQALRAAGLGFEPGSAQAKLFEDRLQGTEPIATFALTNSLAGYLAPWLVVLVGAALLGGGVRRRLLPILLCAVPVAVCLVLTKGRSAYAATMLGLLLLGWIAWKGRAEKQFSWKLPALVAAVVVAAVGLAVVAGGLDRKVATGAATSLGYRLEYWRSTAKMIADRPLLGCGPGNYQFEYTRYKLPEASEEVADPHNFLFEIWATAGTPALLALLAVLAGFFCTPCTPHAPREVWYSRWFHALFLRFSRGGNKVEQGFTQSVKSTERDDQVWYSRWFHALFLRFSRGGNKVEQGFTQSVKSTEDLSTEGHDAAWFVVAGAAGGFLLAVPLGLLSWAPPGFMPIAVGLPCAAVAVAMLSGWIRDGRLPPALPAVAMVVLLVHLLAAGALGFPGVSGTLWLLLAVGLMGDQPKRAPRTAAFGALGLALALAVACHQTAYEPVLQARRALEAGREAAAAGRLDQAEQWLRTATEADPLAADPWRDLAALMLQAWEHTGIPAALEAFREADAEAARREPNSAAAWFVSGDWHLRVHRQTGAAADADRAVTAYSRAVMLYPNSARHRAWLALAHRATGDQQSFEQEAVEALRLDRLTPHADKKLPDALRGELQPASGPDA